MEKRKINRFLQCLVWSLKYLLSLSGAGFSKERKKWASKRRNHTLMSDVPARQVRVVLAECLLI